MAKDEGAPEPSDSSLQAAEATSSSKEGISVGTLLRKLLTARALPPHYYEFWTHVLAFVAAISVAVAVIRQQGLVLFVWCVEFLSPYSCVADICCL